MSVARRRVIPKALFLDGEVGTFSDIRTYATNYYSDAGTTPAELEDTIAQINDQSGNAINWSQGTAASRPKVSARYNLLEETENYASWFSILRGAVTTGVSDPTGGTSAAMFTATSADARLLQVEGGLASGEHISTLWIRRRTGSGQVRINRPNGTGLDVVLPTSEWAAFNASAFFSGTGYVGVALAASGDEVDVYGADLRLASDTDQPTYQRVGDLGADPTDYDTDGFDPYLQFDLVDDQLDCTLAAGAYTVFTPTRAGILIDDVTHAGGTFSFGPTSYTGGATGALLPYASGSVLRTLGPPVIAPSLTAAQQSALVQWAVNRGADDTVTEV